MQALFKHLFYAVALAASWSDVRAADPFPSKPIRIIVNTGTGGQLDVTTRLVAQKMAENLGQPVVVENKGGADGTIGIRSVTTMPADGYTLLATSNTISWAPAVKLDPGYDLVKDFTGIGPMIRTALVMVGAPSQPDKTLADFIARAKANPGTMSFASGGEGTTTHVAAALFLQQAKIKMLHIPYKGIGPAMPDVLSGRVNMMFDGSTTAVPKVRDGTLRAFGVTSKTRLSAFPDIPTIAEQGLPGFTFSGVLGLVASASTPKPVVQRLSEALRAAISSDGLRERFRAEGSEPFSLSPEEYTDFMNQDALQFARLATDLGLEKR